MKLWPSKYPYDAFIIHDVADRETITRKLCDGLEKAGLNIWYSGNKLSVGCNLHEEIMEGLNKSRYGIVILSKNSIDSNWLATELYELLLRSIRSRQKTVLPVLHCITMEDLKKIIIVPDNIWSIASSCTDIESTIEKLVKEIRSEPANFKDWFWENVYALKIWSSVFAVIFMASLFFSYYYMIRPPQSFVEERISSRIDNFQNQILREVALNRHKVRTVPIDTIKLVYSEFMSMQCYYRNEYEFTNGKQPVRSRAGVERKLGINPAALSPYNGYNFANPQIYYEDSIYKNKMHSLTYLLVNNLPVEHEIIDSRLTGEGEYEVEVDYKENIRYIQVNLFYPSSRETPKKHQVSLKGFFPREKYLFEKTGDTWKLKSIE